MITPPENKQLTPLQAAIANHEKALADARSKADQATRALETYQAGVISEYQRSMRPGQVGVYLREDPHRSELERAQVAATSAAGELEAKIIWLKSLLPEKP